MQDELVEIDANHWYARAIAASPSDAAPIRAKPQTTRRLALKPRPAIREPLDRKNRSD